MAVDNILIDTNAYASFKRGDMAAVEIIRSSPFIGINDLQEKIKSVTDAQDNGKIWNCRVEERKEHDITPGDGHGFQR